MTSNDNVKINDFVVRFANVNGTGSASANALFTKAVFRMGVPVTPKNIFPSNIQGLPTWYEVRVSEKGYLGRREGVDLMVAVNPQSMKKDYADVMSGGYFVYDSSKPLPPGYDRDDITHIGIPMTEMCNAEYTDARQRQLFKNIVYIGALVALFKIEFSVIEQLIGEQFKGKEKLIEPNIKALKMGEKWVEENFGFTDARASVQPDEGKALTNVRASATPDDDKALTDVRASATPDDDKALTDVRASATPDEDNALTNVRASATPDEVKALTIVRASATFDLRVERRDLLGDKILYGGNSACALGAIYGGATVAAWYPITPSTSVVDAFAKYASKYRVDAETGKNNYAIVQAEDELAAIGMVMGAMWNGARAFTATSGPGVSLMNEFLGLGYFAEIPTVLIDVQRTGPSTGMPTRTQQSDLLLAAYASHGDTKHPLLLPATPKECFEMTAQAFDLTEQLQTPVIVMTDLDLGMNDHVTEPLEWDDARTYERGKVLTGQQLDDIYGVARTLLSAMDDASSSIKGNGNGHVAGGNGDEDKNVLAPADLEMQPDAEAESAGSYIEQFRGKYGRYLDIDDDGIPYRTIPGTHLTRGAYTTRGSSRDEYAVYTEDGEAYRRNVDRLARKWKTAEELVPPPVFYAPQKDGTAERVSSPNVSQDSTQGVIYFGTSTYAAREAIEMLDADGIHLDAMRPRAFPFGKAFREFVDAHERIFVIEQNRDAQFRSLIMIELGAALSEPGAAATGLSDKLISVLNYDGMPITADNIYRQIKGNLR